MARDPLERPEEAIRSLYAYVAYRIGPGPDAEDVVSEAIERAIRYRSSYNPRKGPPLAWLTGIAANCVADRARAMARQPVPTPLYERGDYDDRLTQVELRGDLQTALGSLDERDRELIALRYGADLKAKDIARLLEMKPNAVEVALHRAVGRLREAMGDF